MILLELEVPGEPVPKGRPRAGRGRIYTPKTTADAEDRLRTLVDVTCRGRQPHEGPVGLAARFYLGHARRADGDNLMKLLADCLQRGRRDYGGVIKDDHQIEEWWCRVHRKARGEKPRTEIMLYTLDGGDVLG